MAGVQTRKMKLRELLLKTMDLQDKGTRDLETLHDLNNIINDANESLSQVDIKELAENTDDVLLDAKIVSAATTMCVETSQSLGIDVDSYCLSDFARHLKKYVNGDAIILNWEKLEDNISDYFHFTPSFSYLYGTFDYETVTPSQQERKNRIRTKLDACAKSQPDKISVISKEEEGVDDTVKKMRSVLREVYKENNSQPISYYHFIFDPDNYPKTIENCFYFSFLIRDGAVKIVLNDKNIPFVIPVSTSVNKDGQPVHNETIQRVVSLDYKTWQELKNILSITHGLYTEKKRHLFESRPVVT